MKVFGKDYSMVYDLLYRDKDYEKESDFIEAVFSKFLGNVKKVLDLGCGTGGHALILASRGYDVVGVDRSQDMLEIAKRKAKESNLFVKFYNTDIAEVNLKEKFDAIIAMFDVMSYQTANSAIAGICRVAKEHLVSGGIFLFDCWHGPAVLTEKPSPRIKEVKLNEKERIIRLTEPILNISSHTVETRFKVWKIQDGCLIKETHESHLMRYLFPQEAKYFLEVAGFNKIKFCPFLELEKPLKKNDWKMAVIANAG